jgi:hypothetical protein
MSYVNQFRQYLSAYARKDLQAIEAMLNEEATLQDWNLVVNGKLEVLRETQSNFEAARSIEIEIKREFVNGRDAAAEEFGGERAVVGAGVGVEKMKPFAEGARGGGFARGGAAVDGDDEEG